MEQFGPIRSCFIAIGVVIGIVASLFAGSVSAQAPPIQKPSTEAEIKAALFGGVPMGRWKEGLLYEGIRPMPWLKSAANWFPGTEDVQPDEMRVTFMGTSPMIRPGQMNTSLYVEWATATTSCSISERVQSRTTWRRASL